MKKEGQHKNLKGLVFIGLALCLILLILANLIPFTTKVSGEYDAAVLSFATREQTGTTKVRFEGTYTRYLFNTLFQDRFEGEFYVEGNSVSEQYGVHAFADFGKGLTWEKQGVLTCYNEELNRLEFVGTIVQKAPLRSGYLILTEPMTSGEDDLIVVFP